jgi:hypothetical protein
MICNLAVPELEDVIEKACGGDFYGKDWRFTDPIVA